MGRANFEQLMNRADMRSELLQIHSGSGIGFIDEPKSSKESRLRACAWSVLRQLRSVLSEAGNVAIPPPAQKTFDAEGEAL